MKNLKFELNEKETHEFEKFLKEHDCIYPDRTTARKACGVEGAITTVSFAMTSIGNMVKVKCNACGKEEDITDYDSV